MKGTLEISWLGPDSEGFNRTIASELESNPSDLEPKLATEQSLTPGERLWIGCAYRDSELGADR